MPMKVNLKLCPNEGRQPKDVHVFQRLLYLIIIRTDISYALGYSIHTNTKKATLDATKWIIL